MGGRRTLSTQVLQTLAPAFLLFVGTAALGGPNVVFVVLSQREKYHASLANQLKENILYQSSQIEKIPPLIQLTHDDFNIPGAWTVISLITPLLKIHAGNHNVHWIFFCEQNTRINYTILLDVLSGYNHHTELWIGYPLMDVTPTIIHHFDSSYGNHTKGGLAYPSFSSGFAISMNLLKMLQRKISSGKQMQNGKFSVDPAFELAKFISDLDGPKMSPERRFCVRKQTECATYPKEFQNCGLTVPEVSIFFAVKTWHENHDSRVHVVKRTWGKFISNVMFFSDQEDRSLPSINVGVNEPSGHCAKIMAIMHYAKLEIKKKPVIRWIVIADDDTILSVHRLCEILSCLNGTEVPMIFGERYGFGHVPHSTHYGYDYITGGGGIVLNVAAIHLLSECQCPDPATPDDMWLGACAYQNQDIIILHSPLFHQARPMDYPEDYLLTDRPISFHKHSMINPTDVYTKWFSSNDLQLTNHAAAVWL